MLTLPPSRSLASLPLFLISITLSVSLLIFSFFSFPFNPVYLQFSVYWLVYFLHGYYCCYFELQVIWRVALLLYCCVFLVLLAVLSVFIVKIYCQSIGFQVNGAADLCFFFSFWAQLSHCCCDKAQYLCVHTRFVIRSDRIGSDRLISMFKTIKKKLNDSKTCIH